MNGARARRAMVAGAAAVLAFAACAPPGGDDDANDNDQTNAADAEVSGTVSFAHDKSAWEKNFDAVFETGEQELGITVEQVPYADPTSYQPVIQSALRSDEAPDLISWWSGYRLDSLSSAGQLTDLSDFWDEQIEAGTLTEDLADAFTEGDGIYAAPLQTSLWTVFYNKKVFEENDLEVPTTWAELEQVADTLKENGVTPFFATTDGRWPAFIWFEEFIARTDPDFYDRLTDGEESYTDALVLDAMREWGEWIDKGYFTNLDLTLDDQMTGQFANGEIGMVLNGTWLNGAFQDAGMKPGTDYDTFVLPNRNPDLDENVIVFEAGSVAIPANAPNPDAAEALLEYWLEPETQQAWSAALQDTPSTPGAKAPNSALQTTLDEVEDGDYRMVERYWEASPPEIVEAAVDELARFMLNPDQAEDVLENIEQIARQEWDARGQ